MNVGIDFGTTNSLISYWDDNSKNVVLFQYKDAVSTPTVVAYEPGTNEFIGIGRDAISSWVNDYNINLMRFFKNNLNKSDGNSSIKYTADFIRDLLRDSSDSFEKNVGKISNLVVSVPEQWQKQANNHGANNLLAAINQVGLPIEQLVSEPLSALAYFIWKNKELVREEKKILVCDMGGGTCDVAYCTVKDTLIKVLSFDGSEDKAGVYDLEQILTNIYKRQGKEALLDSDDFRKGVWELDDAIQKDNVCKKIEENYPNYLENPDVNDLALFKFQNENVFSSDVYGAFPSIEIEITKLLDKIKSNYGDDLSFDHLLFIGGFSHYFLVRNSILSYFNMKEDDAKVNIISKVDTRRAVSYGAALISAGQLNIREYYDHTIVFQLVNTHTKEVIEKDMIKANDIIVPNQVTWNDEVKCFVSNRSTTLKGYILLNGRHKKKFEKRFEVVPELAEGYCNIGVKLNRANVACLVLKNSEDSSKTMEVSLGDLLS